jgi:hypothetical protein
MLDTPAGRAQTTGWTRAILFQDRYFYGVPTNLGWPPKKVLHFLDLQTLEAVPDSYQTYTGG